MSIFFRLEKILTVSAADYCAAKGISLRDYELVGVHAAQSLVDTGEIVYIIEALKKEVPDNAEVVVDYRFAVGGAGAGADSGSDKDISMTMMQYASGTALIPKEKKE